MAEYAWDQNALLFLLFFLHGLCAYALGMQFLEVRYNNKLAPIIYSILYAAVTLLGLAITQTMSFVTYIGVFVVLVINTLIFFKANIISKMACILAVLIHVICIRTVTTAVYAAATGLSCYVLSHGEFLFITLVVIYLVMCLMSLTMLKLVNPVYAKMMVHNPKNVLFLAILLALFNIYMLFNSTLYMNPYIVNSIIPHQIIVSVVMLSCTYWGLYFLVRIEIFHSYKEKTEMLEKRAMREAFFKGIVLSDTVASYEVNCTKDTLAVLYSGGQEHTMSSTLNYSKAIAQIVKSFVHEDDIEWVSMRLMPQNILKEYDDGNVDYSFEYRRIVRDGEVVWVHTAINTSVDAQSGDVIALIVVKNINEEKQEELDLRNRAERDSLTGAYNKQATHQNIISFMSQQKSGALLILDVDDFKSVNDNMGHVYGDTVLCEIVDIINTIFRDDDIVGRVGGDEFMVFMKHTCSIPVVMSKAAQLCQSIESTYRDAPYKVCCSVGISIFPRHGDAFDELYQKADSALYESKNKGKNTATIYSGSEFTPHMSTRTAIDSVTTVDNTPEKNYIENVFKILHKSPDIQTALCSVLELILGTYKFERTHVYNCTKHNSDRVALQPMQADDSHVVVSNFKTSQIPQFLLEAFNRHGGFFVENMDNLEITQRNYIGIKDCKSQYILPLIDEGDLLAFVSFVNFAKPLSLSSEQVEELKILCNLISVFFRRQLRNHDLEDYLKAITTVIDRSDNYVYVIDKHDYTVLFLNKKASSVTGDTGSIGRPCYEVFRGRSSPCEDCPMAQLPNDGSDIQKTVMTYNPKLDMMFSTTASYLKWTNDTRACLLDNAKV